MQSISDLFSLYAELSIAIAGFSGITAAFAGRERMFRPVERTRLLAVLFASSSVLAGCLAYFSASSLGMGESGSTSVGAGVSIILTIPVLVFLVPSGWRHFKDPDSTTEMWVLFLVTLISLILLSLYGVAAAQRGGASLLVTGFSIQLMFGLWMFVRLLTRPN